MELAGGSPVPNGVWEDAPSLPWNTGQEFSGQPAWPKGFSPAAGAGVSQEARGRKYCCEKPGKTSGERELLEQRSMAEEPFLTENLR